MFRWGKKSHGRLQGGAGGLVGKNLGRPRLCLTCKQEREKGERKGSRALPARFKDRLLQTLLHLCARKKKNKGAANTEEFTVG